MSHFYLDSPGAWALYEQVIGDVEREFDRLYRTDPIGSLEEKTALARRLSSLLGLDHLTAQAASIRSKKFIGEITAKLSVTDKVGRLVDYHREVDPAGSLRQLENAVRRWQFGAHNLVHVDACYNMPQFSQANQGEALAYQSGVVEFIYAGPAGVSSGRHAPRMPDRFGQNQEIPCILMAANLSKFQNLHFGKMSPQSPEAEYFHSFRGVHVPLSVLGTLARGNGLYRLKPLTIQRYEMDKSHSSQSGGISVALQNSSHA